MEGRVRTNGSADLIFVGGDVYTVDAARSWARAVAGRDGGITAGGGGEEEWDCARAPPELSDLPGKRPGPGFQDAHVHPVGGVLYMLQCDLNETDALQDYQRI